MPLDSLALFKESSRCTSFVLHINIGTVAERIEQSEDEAKEEAPRSASTSSISDDKS